MTEREENDLTQQEKTEHDRRAEQAQEGEEAPRNGQGQDLTIPGTPADPDSHTR